MRERERRVKPCVCVSRMPMALHYLSIIELCLAWQSMQARGLYVLRVDSFDLISMVIDRIEIKKMQAMHICNALVLSLPMNITYTVSTVE